MRNQKIRSYHLARKRQYYESRAINFLLSHNYNLQIIPASTIKGVKTPDIRINHLLWEIKNPTSHKRKTLEHAFYHGLKQSDNLIFDLRALKSQSTCDIAIRTLIRIFDGSSKAKRLKIITKDNCLLELEKHG